MDESKKSYEAHFHYLYGSVITIICFLILTAITIPSALKISRNACDDLNDSIKEMNNCLKETNCTVVNHIIVLGSHRDMYDLVFKIKYDTVRGEKTEDILILENQKLSLIEENLNGLINKYTDTCYYYWPGCLCDHWERCQEGVEYAKKNELTYSECYHQHKVGLIGACLGIILGVPLCWVITFSMSGYS